jgi:hypothetical protein
MIVFYILNKIMLRCHYTLDGLIWFMAFNASFNNISVISWQSVLLTSKKVCGWFVDLWCLTPLSTIFELYRGGSVLLVEETGVTGENHSEMPQITYKLYHIMLYRVHLAMNGVQTHNKVALIIHKLT